MPVIRLGKIAGMRCIRKNLTLSMRYSGKENITAGKWRDLIFCTPDDQGWDGDPSQSAPIVFHTDCSCQNQPCESLWILDAKFQGNASPHGGTDKDHPIQTELGNKPE